MRIEDEKARKFYLEESVKSGWSVRQLERQIGTFYYAEIGKFSSIAYGARINAVNHPAFTRIAQHRFTYRGKQYDLADENDSSITEWRKENKVIIGNDVWIGHNAIIMSIYAHDNCEIKKYVVD